MSKKSNSSFQKVIDSISERLDQIDARLKALENPGNPSSKAKEHRKKNPSPSKKDVNHNYLRKTINDAKRRYEREHKT
ncbi:hypothetical protein AKJ35_00365 [candidate division MSBL1 archaeon SCGC-AAA833F18]|uniref:Uncharacterized protein n=3 Tax=candidate division MSBL1 TaxID=215777 RepID=A0A133VT08_9EURY|nr:hypothetical protein AKJ47_01705 [candidate division MSBL1 archaeon SCGC-AAA261G05]KXB04763.1 hypothetical protein AKJ48_01525 [candidate division MSBL1 archaeon SCGC-AAA261O19]KXB09599.1 hypothetical protein AKJ35_00365 [candidate division MSBL1 archaeon SCGC-AAA833F18]